MTTIPFPQSTARCMYRAEARRKAVERDENYADFVNLLGPRLLEPQDVDPHPYLKRFYVEKCVCMHML